MAIHSSILAWEIPRTEEPGGLLSAGSQRVGHDRSDSIPAALVLAITGLKPHRSHLPRQALPQFLTHSDSKRQDAIGGFKPQSFDSFVTQQEITGMSTLWTEVCEAEACHFLEYFSTFAADSLAHRRCSAHICYCFACSIR